MKEKALKLKPFDFQRIAIKQLYAIEKEYGFAALFAEMGTGKTFMALAVSYFLKTDINFIIAPKNLLPVWLKEISNVFSIPTNTIVWSTQKAFSKKFEFEINAFKRKSSLKFVLVNTEAFQIKNKLLQSFINKLKENENKSFLILDEASMIKTYNAQRTKNLTTLSCLFDYRILLTGTEITNTILDLYSLFEFLEKDFWPIKNWFMFRARYCQLDDAYAAGGRTFKKVVGFQRMDELMKKVTPYVVRLKKADCLDLPEKIFQIVTFDLPKELFRIYGELKEQLRAEWMNKELTVQTKIALFTRFRQLCGNFFPHNIDESIHSEYISDNPKLDFIKDEIEDTDKAIVWCSFVNEIIKISEETGAERYYGGLTQDERNASIKRFEGESKLLAINPASGAYGLNLQFCNTVYFYTLTTSPEKYWQAQDRCHRIGQKNKVIYKILLYKNTIEERLYNLLLQKRNIADAFANASLNDVFNLI